MKVKETYQKETFNSNRDLQERRPSGAHHSHGTYLSRTSALKDKKLPTTMASEKRKSRDVYSLASSLGKERAGMYTVSHIVSEKKEQGCIQSRI